MASPLYSWRGPSRPAGAAPAPRPNPLRDTMPLYAGRPVASRRQSLEAALLLCVSARRDAEHVARLRALLGSAQLDWAALWLLAEEQQVQPLVARAVSGDALAAVVPEEARRTAEASRLQIMLYNMSIDAELQRIGELLHGRGIPATPLKGTALAQRLYGALDARRCGDIDILVPEADREAAWDLLRAAGYQPAVTVKPGVKAHPFHAVPLVREAAGITFAVELHWNLNDPRFVTVDYRDLWRRTLAAGRPHHRLSPLPTEEMLLFLALHLPKHDTGLMRLLADIDRLVRQEEEHVDWASLLALAGRWRATGLLSFALHLAATLLDTPVPEPVLRQLRPPRWRRWGIDLLAGPRAVLRPPAGAHLRFNRSRLAYCAMLTPLSRVALAYWCYILMPPADYGSGFPTRVAGFARRLGHGLAWTGLALATALGDRRRCGAASAWSRPGPRRAE